MQAVLAQRFDEAFAALSADAFIDDVLLKGMGARHVVCGYDFTFGARRSGNVEMLREKGRQKGFGVTVLDPVMREGEIYSSTSIREALRAGWVSEASELLGHSWEIEGVVELGDQRGRTIGYPDRQCRPGRAPPAALRRLCRARPGRRAEWRPAVANLGRRPTFGKLQENFEVHLFDFAGDLYGKTLRVGADRVHPAGDEVRRPRPAQGADRRRTARRRAGCSERDAVTRDDRGQSIGQVTVALK